MQRSLIFILWAQQSLRKDGMWSDSGFFEITLVLWEADVKQGGRGEV